THEERYDLLVVGGGPAGLAAVDEAARLGLRVGLVDERPTLGGQIFKQPGLIVRDHRALGRDHLRGRRLIERAERSGARLMLSTSCVSLRGSTTAVLVEDGGVARTVAARNVLLAPGAHDRPVVFPGWTLPGVLTAGAAQTIVKTQRVAPGTRVLFAGSGPLALAFPAQLHHYGVNVVEALEAGPPPGPRDLLRIAAATMGNGSVVRAAIGYRTALLRGRVPLRYRRIVLRAEGRDRVERVVHVAVDADWRVVPGTERTVEVDSLCVGYGFFPSVELMRVAGCDLRYDEDLGGPVVVVDDWMRTTVPGISAAGDATGIAGSYVAEDEGRLAVLGIAGDEDRARPIRRRLAAKRRFQRALLPLHRIGGGVYELATPDTVVCRCEEVRLAELERAIDASADINVVKGFTRVTMGLCQGRNCQRQVAALIAARHGSRIADLPLATARSPVRPVAIGALADESVEDRGLFVAQ
ncbi:MAG: FAD-dependent oxidoreductase, partial [Thermoleophilia bacterium]|nr:FAD-dependent oxidoreductase [Thermoleophilia bacterium]